MSPDQLDALLHFTQPHMLTQARLMQPSPWLEATPPVLDRQTDRLLVEFQGQVRLRGAGVFARIGERLLRHSIEGRFNGRRQAPGSQRRSEERRVGKECRYRWSASHVKET